MNTIIPALALAAVPALVAPAFADAPSIYPRPQQCELTASATSVKTVAIHMRKSESKGEIWDKLPAVSGGYALRVEKGALTVWANDEDGLYYAKQTLSQMLRGVKGADSAQADPFPDKDIEAVAKLGELPEGTVVDWPDLPFRGVVEGYYGAPWTLEGRRSLFRFFGRNKMNMYIYGPKDDHFHHGQGCYKPYPADKAREIASLVKTARANHVRFVWAIHPANTVNWNNDGGRPQLDQLCDKLEAMYKLGIRDFGVFVDDSSGEILRPERQAQLCNYITENFIRKHKDVNQTLIMCPTGYNRSWTRPTFLTRLGSLLEQGTHVMWTGDSVVNDITISGQQWAKQHLGRPTFVWWNWPCTDFKRGRLAMGRAYGLDGSAEMKSLLSGFVANPMEHAEANKVALFGVADYTWNITQYQSDKSWRDGIARLYPQCAEAMQCFCDHNSYLLPNVHRHLREESVAIRDDAKAFIASVNTWKPDAKLADRMRKEYKRMASAGEAIAKAEGMKSLQKEIAPWIEMFTLTGRAGDAVIEAMGTDRRYDRLTTFFKAVDDLNQMRLLSRSDWNGGNPRPVHDVEVATYIMTPALKDAFSYANSLVYADLSGRKATSLRPVFSTNGGNPTHEEEKISDGNVNTFWESQRRQEAGHWYCIDFGEPTTVSNIALLMGTASRPDDYAEAGQMEYSPDGKEWKAIGKETHGSSVVVDLGKNPVTAKMVRYRITQPRINWLAIAEFTVNRSLPAYAASTVEGFRGVSTFRDEKMYGIRPLLEYHTAKPGDTIELHFPKPVQGTWFEAELGNDTIGQWAKVEMKTADGKTVHVKAGQEKRKLIARRNLLPNQPVVSMKLTNAGKTPQDVRLNIFKLDVPSADPARDPETLTDENFATAFDCTKGLDITLPVPSGATSALIVGSAECTVNGDAGKRNNLIRRVKLKKGVKHVRIVAPAKKGKMVNEVIFRTKS